MQDYLWAGFLCLFVYFFSYLLRLRLCLFFFGLVGAGLDLRSLLMFSFALATCLVSLCFSRSGFYFSGQCMYHYEDGNLRCRPASLPQPTQAVGPSKSVASPAFHLRTNIDGLKCIPSLLHGRVAKPKLC